LRKSAFSTRSRESAIQQHKELQMQWTPSHYDAYQRAFGSLLAKQLVEDAGAQCFRVTDTGLRAIGVSAPLSKPAPGAPSRASC
jgi:hypothetical protein